ncbi:siroheme synthase [Sulfobacillus acidophilus TPY]|nr:siroheme synthase [Sulfobacillus acidophilus TPY]
MERLVASGVSVTLLAPKPGPALEAWSGQTMVEVARRSLSESDVAGTRILFLADEARALAPDICPLAAQYRTWVNVVDSPVWCDFYSMAQMRRGNLLIAVATAGRAPGMARAIRDHIARELGPEWEARIEDAARRRKEEGHA